MNTWPKREVFLLACALCGVSFASGYLARGYLETFGVVKEINEAVVSAYANWILPRIKDPWEHENDYYFPARYGGEGVQRHIAGKAYPGYTLFCASFEPAAYLVDMHGRKVHEWRLPFSAAWSSPPHIDVPVPDKYVHFRNIHLFANGDLLALYEAPGHWPYAYGMVKMDKNSKLLWGYADLANHDLQVAADGRIYTLVHHVRTKSDPKLLRLLPKAVIDDVVVVLSPEGKELERFSLIDAFLASPYAPLLNEDSQKDVLHTNSLQIVTPEIASIFPFVRPGHILLSHRHRGTISILDPASRTIVWALRISRRSQHSARFLSNGTIGVLKNMDHISIGGLSRIAMVDPDTGGETWAFAGDKDFVFETSLRGSIQALPNGNILVTESHAGRLFEVTPEREIVWEYRVGHAMHGKTPLIFEGQRMDPAALTFLEGRDAAAQKP